MAIEMRLECNVNLATKTPRELNLLPVSNEATAPKKAATSYGFATVRRLGSKKTEILTQRQKLIRTQES